MLNIPWYLARRIVYTPSGKLPDGEAGRLDASGPLPAFFPGSAFVEDGGGGIPVSFPWRLPMTRKISIAELQPQLADVVNRVQASQDRFVITREGKDGAVLLAAEDFEGLLETLDILSDSDLVQHLIEAESELASGGGHLLEDVREGLEGGHRKTLESR